MLSRTSGLKMPLLRMLHLSATQSVHHPPRNPPTRLPTKETRLVNHTSVMVGDCLLKLGILIKPLAPGLKLYGGACKTAGLVMDDMTLVANETASGQIDEVVSRTRQVWKGGIKGLTDMLRLPKELLGRL